MKTLYVLIAIAINVTAFLFAQTATAPDSGDGTSGNPYHIASLENLYWIAADNSRWNKYYIQTADINAADTYNWSGGGWTPIGNSTIFFSGTYDGQKHIIDSVYISRTSSSYHIQGLFGYTYGTSFIKNVYLTNVDISGYDYVGGLIGRSGYNTTLNGGTITDCYVTGRVYGQSMLVGGLIGVLYKSTVERCYSTCDVTGGGSVLRVGGLIGRAESGTIVNNCYSRSTVSANTYCGGFIGSNNGATITNCYSTGTVSAYSYAGGFLGEAVSGSADSCFWDIQTSGRNTSAGGTGKTTAEMKTESTFTNAGWDLISTWEIVGTNYPRLQTNPETALPVEMTIFRANVLGNEIILQWQTVSEVNNFGFEIERRTAESRSLQVNDSLAWGKIGFVEGNGTTNLPKQYSFTDTRLNGIVGQENLSAGKYSYRLKQIDRDGKFSYSQEVEVTINSTPKEFALEQNYPNPFNPATTIGFTLQVSGLTTLKVYDAIGREVATLANEMLEAGVYHQRKFDASNLSSGIYFAKLQNDSKIQLLKMMLIK
ncbi:MAG: GLUG motif-containing protein [Bacteroidota bacterium]